MVENYNPGNIAIPLTASPLSGAPSAPPLSEEELEIYKMAQPLLPPTLPDGERRAVARAMITEESVRPPAFIPTASNIQKS